MQYKIYDIFMYLIAAGIFLYYASLLFRSRYRLAIRIAAGVAGYAVLYGLYTIGNTWINMSAQLVILFLLFHFIYGAKIKVAILHAVILPVVLFVAETISLSVLGAIENKKFDSFLNDFLFYAVANMLSKILYFLLLSIIAGIFSKKNAVKNQNYWLIPLILVLDAVMMMVVNELFYSVEPTSHYLLIWCVVQVLILVISGIFILNHYLVYKRTEEVAALRVEAERNKVEKQYLEFVDKSAKDMQILSHDFKNHLIQIDNAENMQQVHDYIHNLYPTIQQFNAATISNNNTLNMIISKYNSLCALKDICFSYSIESALTNLESSDLTAILGNLLDNAVEAAENSAEKRVDLNIFKKNERLETLILSNSCDDEPKKADGELLSDKSGREDTLFVHGLGLKSVKKTVAKYNGFYEWEYDEKKKEFKTVVSFYK